MCNNQMRDAHTFVLRNAVGNLTVSVHYIIFLVFVDQDHLPLHTRYQLQCAVRRFLYTIVQTDTMRRHIFHRVGFGDQNHQVKLYIVSNLARLYPFPQCDTVRIFLRAIYNTPDISAPPVLRRIRRFFLSEFSSLRDRPYDFRQS